MICIELLTENDELINYCGEPITISPIIKRPTSNINIFRFGLYWEQKLLGSFDSLIDAIEEVELIHNLYMAPYKIGTAIDCEEYYSDDDEDDYYLDGEYEDDFDESEDY